MMAYEMISYINDPIDMACSDCEVHQIPVFEPVTEETLHELHARELEANRNYPEFAKYADALVGEPWEPTPEDFEEYIKQMIADGYLRTV